MDKKNENSTSLSKYLSLCGIASRRKSTELIKNGLVTVNNKQAKEPGFKISKRDNVKYKNKIILPENKVYIMLNKPTGYICTSKDKFANKKALDLIKLSNNKRLFSVGRLDKNSEGLIIFTNDGDYAYKITHPSNRILKKYILELDGKISEKYIGKMLKGINYEGEKLKALKIKYLKNNQYLFVLNEGKNREIRKLANFAEKKVLKLKRFAIGKLEMKNLPEGKSRHMSNKEIQLSLK